VARFLPRPIDAPSASRLSRELSIHPVTASVLVGRGIASPEQARRFLRPGGMPMHDPSLLEDEERASAILREAIGRGDRIAVYGDYDVDGVCGTTVLSRVLAFLGADVRPFLPHRVDDGYGLNPAALARLLGEGCSVVVTVDNGSTRADAIAEAEARGQRIIVTDHHETGEQIPACPFLNPKRPGSGYPFSGLAGCGVAFKLGLALARRMGRLESPEFKAMMPDLLATVAIGTVADVVPLRDENRSLVQMGLLALEATRHAGLRALLAVSRVEGRRIRPSDVGFRIGPRINAAGRLGSAQAALDLLCCEEAPRADRLARALEEGNRTRQRVERKQSAEALERATRTLAHRDEPAIVLGDASWHPGVIGIVAARVAETCKRPAALIAVDGDEARGSARSFGGVRLHEALARCDEHLLTHGGHAFAAGFTLRADRIDRFREAFLVAVSEQARGPAGPRPVDAELPIDAISAPLAEEIDSIGPFGAGNEEPLFCAFGVRSAGRPRRVGADGAHLVFYAASERTSVRAVAFQQAEQERLLAGPIDLAFVLRKGEGPDPVEIHVRELAPAGT